MLNLGTNRISKISNQKTLCLHEAALVAFCEAVDDEEERKESALCLFPQSPTSRIRYGTCSTKAILPSVSCSN